MSGQVGILRRAAAPPIANSVRTPPGAIVEQRTPRRYSSWSSERMNPTWANFEAAYTASPSGAALPGHRRDDDEVGAVAVQQVGQAGAHRVQQPLDVGVDHLLEVLRGSRSRKSP